MQKGFAGKYNFVVVVWTRFVYTNWLYKVFSWHYMLCCVKKRELVMCVETTVMSLM